MQFCVTRVILRDLAALVPQIFHSLHKITHFLTGYINSYCCLVTVAFTSAVADESDELITNSLPLTQNSKSDKKMVPEISIPRLYFMIMEKIRFNTHEQTCI
jgi:hypothetical protein